MVLFRADSNPCIGVGHVMRCKSIALALRELGVESAFVFADNESIPVIDGEGFRYFVLNTSYNSMQDETGKLLQIMLEQEPEALVVDSYFANAKYFDSLYRERKCKIALFDDLQRDIYPCDVLMHYAVTGDKATEYYNNGYAKKGFKTPVLLLGPTYAPLRSEFSNRMGKTIKALVNRVLITTGGSDISHTELALVTAITASGRFTGIVFDVIIGKFNQDVELIKHVASGNPNITLCENVDDMGNYMKHADIAISAGGTTTLELCSCGTPIIVYTCADNQIDAALGMNIACGIPYAGDTRTNFRYIEDILTELTELITNEEKRKELSMKERMLVDGKGAIRAAQVLIGGKLNAVRNNGMSSNG